MIVKPVVGTLFQPYRSTKSIKALNMRTTERLLLGMALVAMLSHGARAAEFDAAAREFRRGDKAVSVGEYISIKTAGRAQFTGGWMVSTPYRSWMKPKRFLDRKTDVDTKAGDLSLSKKEAYTPEGRDRVERACYERAKSMPYVKYWKLINEPEANGFPDRLDGISMKDLVGTLQAAYRGIKRANPHAKVTSPDPCNMYERGRSWLERFIRAGGLQACDVIGIQVGE